MEPRDPPLSCPACPLALVLDPRLPAPLPVPATQQAVIRLAPEWLVNRQVMRMHQGFRSRYYRRLVRRCTAVCGPAEMH